MPESCHDKGFQASSNSPFRKTLKLCFSASNFQEKKVKRKKSIAICISFLPTRTTHIDDGDCGNHGLVEYYWIVNARTANRDPKYGQWSRFLLRGYTNLLTSKQMNQSESSQCVKYMIIALQALRGGTGSTALVGQQMKWRREQHGWANVIVTSPAISSDHQKVMNKSSSFVYHHGWSVIPPHRNIV